MLAQKYDIKLSIQHCHYFIILTIAELVKVGLRQKTANISHILAQNSV